MIILPRCKKHRCCRNLDGAIIYKPVGFPCSGLPEVVVTLDQFEAMRLCDLEGLDQTEAGLRMGVSRGTIQRLLAEGRRKVVEALLSTAVIRISDQKEEE